MINYDKNNCLKVNNKNIIQRYEDKKQNSENYKK